MSKNRIPTAAGAAADPFPALMPPGWVADYAGVTEGTVRRWIRDGLLPYHKPGGRAKSRIMIARKDIDAFLAATRVETTVGPLAEVR